MRLIRSFLCTALVVSPIPAAAQSLLDRSPNVSGDWVGAAGTLYFNFVHRFSASDAPERKVSNVPTFLLAAGLPKRLLAGINYSTNSTLTERFPNEWELFARWAPLSQDVGAPIDLGGQVGYNNASDGLDGEISVARRESRVRIIVAGRALSDPFDEGNVRIAIAGGAIVKLGTYIAVAGDIASLTDRDSTERVAWSAGIHFAIPMTPHTLSIHATNTLVNTLQGASRGTKNRRYGFEFTIPLTLRRYFGRREKESSDTTTTVVEPPPPSDTITAPIAQPDTTARLTQPPVTSIPAQPPADTAQRAPTRTTTPVRTPATQPAARPRRAVKNGMKNVAYLQPRMTISVGTTVEWTNNDPLEHSVTAVNRSFNSGLINPGKTYRHTFNRAGTFTYFCTPHPFMKGTIVVREQ
ncbi:MAG TPA: cupredoxin family copper-binding protein [Gemmatimonadaceae bacterium]